ncbi:MAG: hypothetical protein HY651_05600 [Acidobacteria bacterium]|nr:hypothetical protein [Acidobacteriota bacterium]
MSCYRARPLSQMGVWLAMACVLGAIPSLNPRLASAAPGGARRQDLPAEADALVLRLGTQQRTGSKAVAVPLEFAPREQDRTTQIRVEIQIAEGPWRFQKAAAPRGSSLKISVKQRREERLKPGGEKERSTVLSLIISAGKGPIPQGTVCELSLSLDQSESSERIPLVIREWEISRWEAQSSTPAPALEPPLAEPPGNPSMGCFVFAH